MTQDPSQRPRGRLSGEDQFPGSAVNTTQAMKGHGEAHGSIGTRWRWLGTGQDHGGEIVTGEKIRGQAIRGVVYSPENRALRASLGSQDMRKQRTSPACSELMPSNVYHASMECHNDTRRRIRHAGHMPTLGFSARTRHGTTDTSRAPGIPARIEGDDEHRLVSFLFPPPMSMFPEAPVPLEKDSPRAVGKGEGDLRSPYQKVRTFA